ncbi:MAG: hypothetical protein P8X62_05350, partial [Flavobacteriaceae bacterium]
MKLLEKQLWHLLALSVLIFVIVTLVNLDSQIMAGSFWNISTKTWFITAILIPIVHQVYVLIMWRSELYYKTLSNLLGKYAFQIYKGIFFIFFIGRMVLLIFLAISNNNTFSLNSYLHYLIIIVVSLIAFYAFYSVIRYFGTSRAAGLDHFDVEARKLPLVKHGIFKYTSNSMYTYAFLAFYIPGLIYQSKAAILVTL